ncbi:MAG: DUF882 domain-containing protein [Myxococcales bacterium]
MTGRVIGPFAFLALAVSLAWAQPRARPRPVSRPKPVPSPTVWNVGKAPPVDARGRPLLVLVSLGRGERAELSALTDPGGFATRDLERAAHVLRAGGGDEHPVEPRMLDLVYRIQVHFRAPEVRIVSGYRTPKANSHSNHGKGRAMDFVVAGVPDVEVAKFARELGFVGVGIYPTSHFVHVDVRPQSYFWVDMSGPGRRNRERGILGDLARGSDRRALERGERGIEPFVIAADVDIALRAHGTQRVEASIVQQQDDDDDIAD